MTCRQYNRQWVCSPSGIQNQKCGNASQIWVKKISLKFSDGIKSQLKHILSLFPVYVTSRCPPMLVQRLQKRVEYPTYCVSSRLSSIGLTLYLQLLSLTVIVTLPLCRCAASCLTILHLHSLVFLSIRLSSMVFLLARERKLSGHGGGRDPDHSVLWNFSSLQTKIIKDFV